ncbi:MAG: DUF3604 domain-containing protein [Alphaproteobacteria bacterium]|nr:DUF3604 domain-containing protein [Alphaproteobacteria bacterium]
MNLRSSHSVAILLALAACFAGSPPAVAEEDREMAAAGAAPPQGGPALRRPLYGDLHVHTAASYDSFALGNRATQEEAYRFARGEEVTLYGGRKARLARPLDFAGITDHIEWWGYPDLCTDKASDAYATQACTAARGRSWAGMRDGVAGIQSIPPQRADGFCQGEVGKRRCDELKAKVWAMTRANAAKFYEPGKFTTFVAYEFTQPGPASGSLHRNVVFANDDVPQTPMSTYDLVFDSELWRWLQEACTGRCDAISIPHNQNLSWGFAFRLERRDGTPYTDEDLTRRAAVEPLAEMFQIKGSSECTLGIGTTDEACAFEQIYPACEEGQKNACQRFGSTVRDALKLGLQTEQERGINPFKFGFIGSSDTHNSNPGDTEERSYRGAHGTSDDAAAKRLVPSPRGTRSGALSRNPGGLAGVWAEENSREAIFAAMRRRETFGTSGGRIAIRMFAGFGFADDLLAAPDRASRAYSQGTAMGQDLPRGPDGATPALFVEAARDPLGAPLAKLQIVKGWLDGDKMWEAVYDVACSGGREPDARTHQCPDNGAGVDLSTCSRTGEAGADALSALWRDPHFDAAQPAFYYARVLEDPTCRWSSVQAIEDGRKPPSSDWVAPTIRERAWSSPIWYGPRS